MDKILIRGGNPLNGKLQISGAKNAALPLMATCLLTDQTITFSNMPHLHDIASLAAILGEMGVEIGLNGKIDGGADGRVMTLNAGALKNTTAPYELVRKMRASVLVLGPLIARHGSASVSLPGGCAIGTRPVDLHISGLEQLGAEIELDGGYIHAKAPQGLTGAHITFPKVSVGATENIMMAATLAKGETTLSNAAREPEITDLGECLIAMGAKITGLGTDTIKITGVETLNGCTHTVLADRIETGTYIMAGAMTGGELTLTHTRLDFLEALLPPLHQAGIDITENKDTNEITVKRQSDTLNAVDIMTEPYPGFPTDLQAQIMAMLTIANGAGMVTETIFENRFMHVPELTRMGANITIHGSSALVRGVPQLTGAEVMATDLRASVSLVMAGLAAKGETIVNRIYHLDRGYEKLVEKLSGVGADLERIT